MDRRRTDQRRENYEANYHTFLINEYRREYQQALRDLACARWRLAEYLQKHPNLDHTDEELHYFYVQFHDNIAIVRHVRSQLRAMGVVGRLT